MHVEHRRSLRAGTNMLYIYIYANDAHTPTLCSILCLSFHLSLFLPKTCHPPPVLSYRLLNHCSYRSSPSHFHYPGELWLASSSCPCPVRGPCNLSTAAAIRSLSPPPRSRSRPSGCLSRSVCILRTSVRAFLAVPPPPHMLSVNTQIYPIWGAIRQCSFCPILYDWQQSASGFSPYKN
jgi:hypothetical protein